MKRFEKREAADANEQSGYYTVLSEEDEDWR
jgi:hypothetical protein